MANNPDDWLLNDKPLPPPSFSQQLRRIAETNSSSNVFVNKEATQGIELAEVDVETDGMTSFLIYHSFYFSYSNCYYTYSNNSPCFITHP